MKKKLSWLTIFFFALILNINAQETRDTTKKIKKITVTKMSDSHDSDKKIIRIEREGDNVFEHEDIDITKDGKKRIEKKITIMVDGDKITINGKPIESMSEHEIMELKGNSGHLGLIAPHLKGKKSMMFKGHGNVDDMKFNFKGDVDQPSNKALLGVVTDKDEKGAKISSVSKESAAEKAGLKKDDIITKINTDNISNSDDLIKSIGKYNPNETVKVTYMRDSKTNTANATLGKNDQKNENIFMWNGNDKMLRELPRSMAPMREMFGGVSGSMMGRPKLGLKVQDVIEGDGVKVLEVDAESPSEKSGLKKDDVITEVNNESVKNVDDLRAKTKSLKHGENYKVKYTRSNKKMETEIKIPKKLKTAEL